MSDRRAYWQFDRDESNRFSTEQIGRDLPEADEHSPMAHEGDDPDRIGEKWEKVPARYRRPARPTDR